MLLRRMQPVLCTCMYVTFVSFLRYRTVLLYTIGNLRPELRSTHRAIQLVACVTSPCLKRYGFESILKPFIEDVKTLNQVYNNNHD